MKTGFSDEEYARVRAYLIAAFDASPAVFNEDEMLDKLRRGEWLLVTTYSAACVLQFFIDDDSHKGANILLLGGRIGGSLREVIAAMVATETALKQMDFSYICATPRPEFAKYLLKRQGFERAGKEIIKRL